MSKQPHEHVFDHVHEALRQTQTSSVGARTKAVIKDISAATFEYSILKRRKPHQAWVSADPGIISKAKHSTATQTHDEYALMLVQQLEAAGFETQLLRRTVAEIITPWENQAEPEPANETKKVRLYLDVDGVLNAFQKTGFEDEEHFDISITQHGMRRTFTIRYSPTVIATIDAWREKYDAELVWLSTWNENSFVNLLPGRFGGLAGGRILHPKNPLNLTRNVKSNTAWKAEMLIEDQRKNPSPFVWVDDEAVHHHAHIVLAELGDAVEMLTFPPHAAYGLTQDELQFLEEFILKYQPTT